jgi:hypothetical protein
LLYIVKSCAHSIYDDCMAVLEPFDVTSATLIYRSTSFKPYFQIDDSGLKVKGEITCTQERYFGMVEWLGLSDRYDKEQASV